MLQLGAGLAHAQGTAAAREAFINEGFKPVLARCQLPRTCADEAPLSATRWVGETGNDNRVDKRTLEFPGLKLEFVYLLGNASEPRRRGARQPTSQTPVILKVQVTSARWPAAQGLAVGARRRSVEAVLGAGQALPDQRCVSYASEQTQNEVVLCYAGTTLKSLTWTPWWDG